jgi:hypothetical protein
MSALLTQRALRPRAVEQLVEGAIDSAAEAQKAGKAQDNSQDKLSDSRADMTVSVSPVMTDTTAAFSWLSQFRHWLMAHAPQIPAWLNKISVDRPSHPDLANELESEEVELLDTGVPIRIRIQPIPDDEHIIEEDRKREERFKQLWEERRRQEEEQNQGNTERHAQPHLHASVHGHHSHVHFTDSHGHDYDWDQKPRPGHDELHPHRQVFK